MSGRVASTSPAEVLRALGVLAEPPAEGHRRMAEALGLERPPTRAEYTETFVLGIPPYASVHLGAEGMIGGEARDRVAGFWRAVGQVPPAEPDHLSALLGLYATLAEHGDAEDDAERAIATRARRALLHEHLAPWVPMLVDRVAAGGPPGPAAWAALLARVLAHELRLDPDPEILPLHLREAPPLPDPRVEGGDVFLRGLLAPVRTGMILTRSDLSAVARELDVGTRLGPRRRVLQHLLAQDAPRVLAALAERARTAAAAHARRAELLGATAAWWEERASAAAELLEALRGAGAEGGGTGEAVG